MSKRDLLRYRDDLTEQLEVLRANRVAGVSYHADDEKYTTLLDGLKIFNRELSSRGRRITKNVPGTRTPKTIGPSAADRRAEVEASISSAGKIRAITRNDIWTVAGYKDATEFERWQRDDKRTTKSADRNFTFVGR